MIIWLASYPRSGNTLLRQILKQVFGQETYSDSNDLKDLGLHKAGRSIVGHRNYQESWDEFYDAARRGDRLCFVKTHGPPRDLEKAICIVRDGRSAIVSYYHLLRDYRRRADIDLTMVIRGETPMGSWSKQLDAWQPLQRADSLLLRFENLRLRPEKCISDISNFTGLRPVNSWVNPLRELRTAMPGFARHGDDRRNIEELNGENDLLFWELHGDWMERLGYGDNAPTLR